MSDLSKPLPLLAVPNVSEGRDMAALGVIAAAFTAGGGASLLDLHSDEDHHRAVFTLAGAPGGLARALMQGMAETVRLIDIGDGRGQHPHVGAVDVAPMVYLDAGLRGAACAEALVVADRVGVELGIPVFLYGELSGAAGEATRTRAELRRGGRAGLAERMASGEQRPDFGPSALHATAGAMLVAAREPLVAFNLELAPPVTVADARRIAAAIREGGAEGLPGLRAIGVALHARLGEPRESASQVSMNVERPLELPLVRVVEAVARHAEVVAGEIVGLAPRAALAGFPEDVPLLDFDPERQVIENALGL